MMALFIGLIAIVSIVCIVGVVSCCIISSRSDEKINTMMKREVK